MIVVFAATRAVLHASGLPYFDAESYTYLAGADALHAGKELPRAFADLHLVPGYAYLIDAIWSMTGGITLTGVAIAQSVISLLGFLAFSHLVSLWLDRRAGICVFLVLCLSPSIGWLERTLMPEALAAPLLMIAFWAAAIGNPASDERKVRWGGALLAGAFASAAVLMRTSSQPFAILPLLLAFERRAGFKRTFAWTLLYVFALAAPLAPWIQQNHEKHGIYALTASRGRSLYLNAAWTGTLDRRAEMRKYGIPASASPEAAIALTETALRRQVASGLALPKADAILGQIASKAYENRELTELGKQRWMVVRDLFAPATDGAAKALTPLSENREAYLANRNATPQARSKAESRMRYRFSSAYVEAAAKPPAIDPRAPALLAKWIELGTIDGGPLFASFLFSFVVIYWRSPLRWPMLIVVACPALAFLTVLAFFGAPRYLYQASLQPFLAATIVVACITLLGPAKRKIARGLFISRRLKN